MLLHVFFLDLYMYDSNLGGKKRVRIGNSLCLDVPCDLSSSTQQMAVIAGCCQDCLGWRAQLSGYRKPKIVCEEQTVMRYAIWAKYERLCMSAWQENTIGKILQSQALWNKGMDLCYMYSSPARGGRIILVVLEKYSHNGYLQMCGGAEGHLRYC